MILFGSGDVRRAYLLISVCWYSNARLRKMLRGVLADDRNPLSASSRQLPTTRRLPTASRLANCFDSTLLIEDPKTARACTVDLL